MSTIDVSGDIEIAAAPADIAGVMFDAQREPEWIGAVKTVELLDPALVAGARVRRTGTFMGRDIAWTTEVERVHFPHVLSLRIVDGPFLGTMTCEIQRRGTGSHVRVRSVGDVPQLGFLPTSLVTGPMSSALRADLGKLKAIVEAQG